MHRGKLLQEKIFLPDSIGGKKKKNKKKNKLKGEIKDKKIRSLSQEIKLTL